MKTKLVKPVLVDSEIANIYKCRTGGLGYKEVATSYTVEGQGQQLILISLDPDEKIEVGDLVLTTISELEVYNRIETFENRCDSIYCKKVIATQDKISPEYIQQFIEEYNKGEVKDIEIEMNVVTMQESSKSYEDNDILVNGKIVESIHYELTEAIDKTIEKYGKQPKLTNGFITIIEKSNIEKQADLVEEIAFENLKVKEPITYTEEEVLGCLNNLNDLLEEKQYISNINEGVISTSNMSIKEINELNKREEYIQSITNDNFEIDVKKWFEQNRKR
jgi:hypothetical protein